MMSARAPLVIVGASYAGTQLAATARELGFDAPIILLGEEGHAPYQRPPLSKGLLTGKTSVDALALRGPGFFADQAIDLQLGRRAKALDAAARTLTLDDGGTLGYGWLALATGARCRALPVPGADLDGIYNLRTLDDALRISDALAQATRACVIGGGFIGLEVASALAARGASVTVVESQPRLLARSFPPLMSDYLAGAHRQRGVEVVLGRGVRALSGDAGRIRHVELDDGSRIACDMVVLGIGVQPNIELALEAGIACDNGILTDALGRTSAPQVIAVGDVANTLLPAVPGSSPSRQPTTARAPRPARWRARRSPSRAFRGSGATSTSSSCRWPDCPCPETRPSCAARCKAIASASSTCAAGCWSLRIR